MAIEKLECGTSKFSDVFDSVNRLIDSNLKTGNPQINAVNTIVAIGASITSSMFGSDAAVTASNKHGFAGVAIDNRAVSGYSAGDVLADLPAILSTYSGDSGILFFMHVGGNNVTNTRPYSTATASEIAELSNDVQSIISLIRVAGHLLVMANITYRQYSGAPEVEGSLPYNTNIIEPIMRTQLSTMWDYEANKPVIDLYTLIFENQSWLTDGTHLSPEGQYETVDYIFERMAKVILQPIAAFSPTSGATFVVDLNDGATYSQTNSAITVMDALNTNLNSTVFLNGAHGESRTLSFGNSGVGNAGDTSTSLTNDILLKTYRFKGGAGSDFVSLINIEPGSSGTVSLTASRSGDERIGEYTVQGVMIVMDPSDLPAPTIDFNFIIGSDGVLLVEWEPQAGSSNAYLSGMQVAFD